MDAPRPHAPPAALGLLALLLAAGAGPSGALPLLWEPIVVDDSAVVLAHWEGTRAAGALSNRLACDGLQPGRCAVWEAREPFGDFSWSEAKRIVLAPDGATAYVTGWRGGYATFAYDVATGEARWSAVQASRVQWDAGPRALALSPDGALLAVGGPSGVFGYDAAAGTLRWHAPGASHALGFAGGALVATGQRWGGQETGQDVVVRALDLRSGAEAWNLTWTSPGVKTDRPLALASHRDTVYVVGVGGTPLGSDMLAMAIDATTGELRWARTHGPGIEGVALAAVAGPQGLWLTGWSRGPDAVLDLATRSYAPDGALRWAFRYEGPHAWSMGRALALAADGATVYAAGSVFHEGRGHDVLKMAHDAATGEVRWVAEADGAHGREQEATALALSPDGHRLLVTGRANAQAFPVLSYDTATGARSPWHAAHGALTEWRAEDAALTPDGTHLLVAGMSRDAYWGRVFVTAAYRAG